MAILRSHGVLIVDAIPTHSPTAEQARLARLQDTFTFYFYNGSAWVMLDLFMPDSYAGSIISDNSNLGDALQALETAVEAITQDGNHELVTRGNTIEDVAPTVGEIASPVNGDTADILLTNGKLEKWAYTGGSWSKAFTIDYTDVTNLNYTVAPNQGTVTSSNGTDAIIPLADGTNAGLMNSAEKTKVGHISVTQAVDLDAIEALLATALQTVTDTNSIDLTKTGTAISADLKISATQGAGVTVTVEADGLKVETAAESEPTGYLSKVAAGLALGAGKKFQYLAANLDGAVEGTVAWT